MKKISTLQLVLISTGGMIGSGWLFSPYYGYQTAGIGVLISWLVTGLLTFIIGLSFAEVSTILSIVGGVSRFVSVTHKRQLAFVFLFLGWLSYVVYLPLEAQSAVQYLGFWFDGLVVRNNQHVSLSVLGLSLTLAIMIFLTWFNSLLITKVTKANLVVSIWKILIPLIITWIFILYFGKWQNIVQSHNFIKSSWENILLAITTSGLAFAFTGFQNGLILANNVANKKRALPYSIFFPIVIGLFLYMSLSMAFIACLGSNQHQLVTTVAPLLGLVSLFAFNLAYVVLFIDAIIAPLGTANVYTAVTSRILYGLAKDFLPNSLLVRLNKSYAPIYCLWLNTLLGIFFLLPFPTWSQLVDFLSSIVIFAYLAGPIALITLRQKLPNYPRLLKIPVYKILGYLGFSCCSLFIYWSGLNNLIYLTLILLIGILLNKLINKKLSIIGIIIENWYIIAFSSFISLISYWHKLKIILFPLDNILIILASWVFCYIFVRNSLDVEEINLKLEEIHQ